MNKSFIVIIAAFLVISNSSIYAGIDPKTPNSLYQPNIIPPAPTAASLGRFGEINTNLVTGAPSLAIPLLKIAIKGGELSLDLNYSSNGIKVDGVSSWVGQEWVLNTGGVITREVMGGADEDSRTDIPEDLLQLNPTTESFVKYHWDNLTDTEPDIFNYTFPGYTGKFVVNFKNKKIYSIPHNNLRFEYIYDLPDGIISFTITTPDGIQYLFGEEYFDKTKIIECSQAYRTYISRPPKTAWHLKKILYPNSEEIFLHYKPYQLDYYSGINQTIQVPLGINFWCNIECPMENNYECQQKFKFYTWYITEIITSDSTKIAFKSHQRSNFDDLQLDSILEFNSMNNKIKSIVFAYVKEKERIFLDNLYIRGSITNENPQIYSFDYININALPNRLSFSQDHWGYYNGRNNNSLIVVPYYLENFGSLQNINSNREPSYNYASYGLLKSITYPTGGTQKYEYQQNTYSKPELFCYPPVSYNLGLFGQGCSNGDEVIDSIDYFVPFDQTDTINGTMFFTDIGCAYVHTRHYGKISIKDITGPPFQVLLFNKRIDLGFPVNIPVDYQGGHTYRAYIKACGEGTEIDFGTNIDTAVPRFIDCEKLIGGVRLKRIITNSTFNSIDTINYFYGDTTNLNKSSAVYSSLLPIYDEPRTQLVSCGECISAVLHSNSINSLCDVGGKVLMYQTVIISHGNNFLNGGERYQFLINQDFPGNFAEWTTNNILSAKKNNESWDNGLLLNKLIFKYKNSKFIPIQEIKNVFTYSDPSKDTTFFGYVIRKNYENDYNMTYQYTCNENDLDGVYNCITETCFDEDCHKHVWSFIDGFSKCTGDGANNIYFESQCDSIGQILLNNDALSNYDCIRYDIYCEWSHLDTVITKTYNSEGRDPIVEIKYFEYNNHNHTLPNKTVRIQSDGSQLANNSYYPEDYSSDAIAQYFPQLVEKHIINIPIDQREYFDLLLINGRTYHYNGNGFPTEIDIASGELGAPLSFNNNNPYSYGSKEIEITYDNNQIESYKNINNINTVILWGYRSLYPIAEIIGATKNEIESKLNSGGFNLTTLRESTDSNYITEAVDYLRNNLTNCFVTSYTYVPQIGISSKTDASGIRITYEYDSSGKLQNIKDSQGNILQYFQYNYAIK